MYDVLAIAAIADELSHTILDGRIQRIGLVDARTLAAEIYAGGRRRTLLASADDRHARLYLSDSEPALDPTLITPFALLLRKYARGGVIVGIEQPPLERLVRLSIAKRQTPHNERRAAEDHPRSTLEEEQILELEEEIDPEGLDDAVFVHLSIEIMGRHSNLILVGDDGRIMESVKRVTHSMSRVRPILPRLPFVVPPPIDKRDPRRVTAVEMEQILSAEPANAELAGLLVRYLRAVSPQMAREVSFRVAGQAKIAIRDLPSGVAGDIAREMRYLLEPLLTGAWQPKVYRDEDEEVAAFAPIEMGHLAAQFREEAVATICRAAELAEGLSDSPGRHGQRRARLVREIQTARERVAARAASIQEQADKATEADTWRESGDLIYAYLWSITPGQRELVVDGVTVPLDPDLSAKENAQAYFERYRRARSAGEHLPELAAKVETDLAYLDQLLTLASQSDAYAEIEAIGLEFEAFRRAIGAAGIERRKPLRRSVPPRRPKPLVDADGNLVYIGRSGAQNDAVTFDVAGPNDTWLHARGVPGSHVVVRWQNPDGTENDRTLEAAAVLAAYYSNARESGRVEVDATRRRHVRKIKGAGPGMVTYRDERTLAVRPAAEAALADVLREQP